MNFLSALFAVSSEHKIALTNGKLPCSDLNYKCHYFCYHYPHFTPIINKFPHVSGSSNLARWKVFPIWKVFQIKVSSASPQMERHHPQENQNAKVWNIDFFYNPNSKQCLQISSHFNAAMSGRGGDEWNSRQHWRNSRKGRYSRKPKAQPTLPLWGR